MHFIENEYSILHSKRNGDAASHVLCLELYVTAGSPVSGTLRSFALRLWATHQDKKYSET